MESRQKKLESSDWSRQSLQRFCLVRECGASIVEQTEEIGELRLVNTVTRKILIGQRVRSINWRTDRRNGRAQIGQDYHYKDSHWSESEEHKLESKRKKLESGKWQQKGLRVKKILEFYNIHKQNLNRKCENLRKKYLHFLIVFFRKNFVFKIIHILFIWLYIFLMLIPESEYLP